jgi:hypothetical protein
MSATPSETPPPLPPFPADALNRLAELILAGDVVFFIGAGFSIDSERNTGQRLIRRLLIRLESLTHHLGSDAGAIRDSLRSTFDLSKIARGVATRLFPYKDEGPPDSDIDKLAARYFETNDWFCRAFAELLRIAVREIRSPDRAEWIARIHAEEEAIRLRKSALRNPDGTWTEAESPTGAIDAVPIDSRTLSSLMDWIAETQPQPDMPARLQDVAMAAGKALFLDTMGFRDPLVMAGAPTLDSPCRLRESYANRLLPRHHFIARLARDGLCTTTVTTNFDLLLEGSFRLAGFAHRTAGGNDSVPPTQFAAYAPVASPVQFFDEGKAHRTAVLVKMHGCAGTYRNLDLVPATAPRVRRQLEHYLKSMVFTYREIQNWREDAWAADFLRTLLRTRTVVFAGYSLQDPVVHDTFRTVYEEMARIRRADTSGASDLAGVRSLVSPTAGKGRLPLGPGNAPAFFLDVVDPESPDKTPFHALEVLNAASDAVGAPRERFGDHPNFVRFHRRNRSEFPNLDEVCRWLFHVILRFRQRECLRDDLQRTLTALHGRSRPEVELRRVQRNFHLLFALERGTAPRWNSRSQENIATSRRQLGRLCSWSESFHVGLLREFAAVDQLRRRGGLGLELSQLRLHGWYYPIMQDSGWTCWGTVVELALRRMIRAVLPRESAHPPGAERIWAGTSDVPTVLFHRPLSQPPTVPPTPASPPYTGIVQALSIQFGGFEVSSSATSLFGLSTHNCVWLLRDDDAPWRPTEWETRSNPPHLPTRVACGPVAEPSIHRTRSTVTRRPPPASVLWRWASGTESHADRDEVPRWLGLASN